MMKTREITQTPGPPTKLAGILNALDKVTLSPRNKALKAKAERTCGGSYVWSIRKLHELSDLLALAEVSGCMTVKDIDMTSDLQAVVELRVPIPLRPENGNALPLAPKAILGLTYSEEALILPQPGYRFVNILVPNHVWHANVGPMRYGQPLCLGLYMEAAIPLKEIVLRTYGALTMQTIQIDELDPAGVLNPEAARWWQNNVNKIPLTQAPFICRSRKNRA